MRKRICLLLALVLIMSLAACGQTEPAPDQPAQPTESAADTPNQPVQLPEGTPNYFQLSISDENGNYKSLSAYDDGMGQITVDYQGSIRKVTTLEYGVMDQIAQALAQTGLPALNGENIYEDGAASASMYVAYPNGDYLGAGYGGTIPQTFLEGYDVMDAFFRQLLADVPEYVARPVVMGDVYPEALAAMESILEQSGMKPLDMFCISDVPKDEYFTATMGLADQSGVLAGTSCSPMMSATAYSCVIITLANTDRVLAVQRDFVDHIDWNKWVCVSADSAMIAQKDNMVLCLVASGEMYARTAAAIEADGWTVLQTLKS